MDPIDRALRIFGVLADRQEVEGARKGLSDHLATIRAAGENDGHRLTVEGLIYLQTFHRQIDSRN
jgi:hypothetical protein